MSGRIVGRPLFANVSRGRSRPLIVNKTGLVIDAYFSEPRSPGSSITSRMRGNGRKGCWPSGRSILADLELTGGSRHVTDCSNASRTMLYNIHTRRWDDDLVSERSRTVLPK